MAYPLLQIFVCIKTSWSQSQAHKRAQSYICLQNTLSCSPQSHGLWQEIAECGVSIHASHPRVLKVDQPLCRLVLLTSGFPFVFLPSRFQVHEEADRKLRAQGEASEAMPSGLWAGYIETGAWKHRAPLPLGNLTLSNSRQEGTCHRREHIQCNNDTASLRIFVCFYICVCVLMSECRHSCAQCTGDGQRRAAGNCLSFHLD